MGDCGCDAFGDCLDRILTNRFLAYPILAAVVYVVLSCALWAAEVALWATELPAAALVFLPVLAFLLAFLEACGYLARAEFMTDWAFRCLGWDGRALKSLVMGMGCVLLVRMVFAHGRFAEGMLAQGAFGSGSLMTTLFAVYVPGVAAALWCACLRRLVLLRWHAARRDGGCHLILVMPAYRVPDGRSVLRCARKLLLRFAAGGGAWLLVFYGAVWTALFLTAF